MKQFGKKTAPAIYVAVWLSMLGVFAADVYTPLGMAVWVFYLAPVVLSFFIWRAVAPLFVAGAVTVLVAFGFVFSAVGMDPSVATLNRSFGLITVWVIAGIGYQFISNRLAVRKEEWLQSGQTQLSERVSGDQRLEELGENVLRFLAEYTEAKAGAIFMEDSGHFRRFATYAVPSPENVPERFTPGQSLLGQAAKNSKLLVIRDVPEGYLVIGSGLGQSRPRHLVIAPMMVDKVVNVVVELGFFHTVDEAQKQFLSQVSEPIAVAVKSARYRARLQDLLEETQRQAEELQAQSEELRVSNEELEEQSRALKESQANLEQQQIELEQSNSQLEEQTQLLEAQKDDLERQARIVEKASRYKSDFLANMSHELRTPLNSSLILAKLLADNREGNLTAEQIKYAQTIQSAGNDLLALINDVLDLSKVEAGHLELNPEQVRLESLLENLRGTFGLMAAQKGLELVIQIAADAPECLETDPQRLEQVLKNLLSNALKFTDNGEVTLEVKRIAGGKMAFVVRDTGIGIAHDQQRVIFEPFCQADGTTNRKYGGTGLGLSISRELARLLGGEIFVTSELGRGSAFTVVLPEVLKKNPTTHNLSSAETSATARMPRDVPGRVDKAGTTHTPSTIPTGRVLDDRERLTGTKRMILIVEDDVSFAQLLSDLAHEMDFQSLIATTAEEALALAQQLSPSAVVLDVGLPDNSGLFVLERLKRDSRTRHIPVHIVSGSDYAETALALGAVGYMLKPVQREQLVEAFKNLEARLTQKIRRVFVVEDDPVQLDSLRLLLGSREVETVGAQTAAECLEQLKTMTFDCMVLDLSLPDGSGFSLLEKLSTEDAYSFPPVIIYTGRELTANEEQRLRKYSKSIIIKGAMSPERLLDEVTLFLHQVVSDLPPEHQKMLEQARSRDAAMEGRTILLVEDDVRNIFALTSFLEPFGVKIQIARNGREGIEALERSLVEPAQPVDLVLMDIMMPEMDGLTAMREIRKRPELKRLPIVALTAKAMKQDQENCLEAGANDYLAKPLDMEKLLSLIRVWMPR